MCCGSPSVTFGWLGGVVVNFAFASLVVWGAATNWPVGMAFSAVYTAALFWFSAYLRKNFAEKVEGLRRATDVLLLVAVFGVGVTTLFLPVNLIGCAGESSGVGATGEYNNAPVPAGLAEWASHDLYATLAYDAPSYARVNGSLFFSGSNGTNAGSQHTLMVSRALSPEVSVVDNGRIRNPTFFVKPTDSSLCFVALWRRETAESTRTPRGEQLLCTLDDGTTVFALNLIGDAPVENPWAVVAHGGLVYFKGSATNTLTPRNGLIYVADPVAGTLSLLAADANNSMPGINSTKSEGSDSKSDACDTDAATQTAAVVTLFVTSLPLLIIAIFIGVKWNVASMSAAVFVGMSVVVVNLYVIADPKTPDMESLLKWWFTVFSAVWLASCLMFSLSNRVLTASALSWAMNVGGVFYFGAMHAQLEIPFNDVPWRWVVYQFVSVLPLFGLGIATDKTLLLLLSAAGLIIDVFRLSTFLIDLTSNDAAKILIRFTILAASGMGIVFGGFKYQQLSPQLQKKVSAFARTCLRGMRNEGGQSDIKVAVEITDLPGAGSGGAAAEPSTQRHTS
eukprot:g4883.t1